MNALKTAAVVAIWGVGLPLVTLDALVPGGFEPINALEYIVSNQFHETPAEIILEESIGKEIYLRGEGAERDMLLAYFMDAYAQTSEGMDNFDRQFALICDEPLLAGGVYLDLLEFDSGMRTAAAGVTSILDSVRLNLMAPEGIEHLSPSQQLIIFNTYSIRNQATLAHELAHVWDSNLDTSDRINFYNSWRELSGVGDLDNYTYAEDVVIANNSLTPYSLTSTVEDIAEFQEVIYLLNNEPSMVIGLKDELSYYRDQSLEGIVAKVRLLEEYGFISEREANVATQIIRAN